MPLPIKHSGGCAFTPQQLLSHSSKSSRFVSDDTPIHTSWIRNKKILAKSNHCISSSLRGASLRERACGWGVVRRQRDSLSGWSQINQRVGSVSRGQHPSFYLPSQPCGAATSTYFPVTNTTWDYHNFQNKSRAPDDVILWYLNQVKLKMKSKNAGDSLLSATDVISPIKTQRPS